MRLTHIISVCVLIGSIQARAQTTRPADATDAAQDQMKRRFLEMVQRTSAPTEQHRALAALVGDFDEATEVPLGPGEPMRARGVSHGRWVMGGRFVEVDGAAAPDEPLKGERMVVYGYDPAAKK